MNMKASIKVEKFGQVDGAEVSLFILTNSRGAEARIMNYGGIVQSLKVPDREGRLEDIVLGYDDLAGYVRDNSPYFGALIGRFGNRIAGGRFTLHGREYILNANDNGNSLHGGYKGFDKVVWKPVPAMTPDGPSLTLRYLSPDGEEGYPGNLSVTAVHTLTESNELALDYMATTDQDTLVNLTHHSYFNLAGKGNILDHIVTLNSDAVTPHGEGLVPSGEIMSVVGTPLDFRKSRAIGAGITSDDPIIKEALGYDHNYLLQQCKGEMELAARVYAPSSGRVMEVLTTAPAFQFYTGNFLDGTITGKGGRIYQQRDGLCIEPQHYPDSLHYPSFPSTILRPGATYRNRMIYRFGIVQGC